MEVDHNMPTDRMQHEEESHEVSMMHGEEYHSREGQSFSSPGNCCHQATPKGPPLVLPLAEAAEPALSTAHRMAVSAR